MAGFDPSVIASIPDGAPNPEQAKQNAYTLYDTKNKVEMNSLNLSQAKEEQTDRLAAKKILSQHDLSTDKGKNEALEEVAKKSPDLAMKYQKDFAVQKGMNLDNEMKKYKVAEEQVAPMINSIDSTLSDLQQRKELYDKGQITKADLDGATQRAVLPKIMALKLDHPELAPYLDKFLENKENLTFSGLESTERSTKDGLSRLKSRMDEIKTAQGQQRADTQAANEQSLEKERLSLEKHRLSLEGGERNKPEAGYEWKNDKDHSQGEVPIKGGSKDTEKPMTGREAQIFDRIVGSGKLAVASLKNVTKLPSSASKGFLGIGSGPGSSIIGSTKDQLLNKMSDQTTQFYNTAIAGLSRNLGQIETRGLAPGANFVNSFDAVQWRSTDTGLTKLGKLAESRQIVEQGLVGFMDNPRVPDVQKKAVQKIIDDVKEAIPFSVEDVYELDKQQQKNPKTTMQDVIKKSGLDKKSGDLPSGFVLDK